MIEIGSRLRPQPPPPHVVFEALARPDRDPARPWLDLLPDEVAPQVLSAQAPHAVVWTSLWPRRPDAQIRFDLQPGHGGTDLRWTLLVEEPEPDASTVGHFRMRLNQLINADLRFSFGQ